MLNTRLLPIVAVLSAVILMPIGASALAGRDLILAANQTPEPTEAAEGDNGAGAQWIANEIAGYFKVPASQVQSYFDQGMGLGEIFRAYTLAQFTKQPVATIIADRQAGTGWGQIFHNAGLQPGGPGLGSIIGQGHNKNQVMSTPGPTPSGTAPAHPGNRGNGKGNGNANGNRNNNGAVNGKGHTKP